MRKVTKKLNEKQAQYYWLSDLLDFDKSHYLSTFVLYLLQQFLKIMKAIFLTFFIIPFFTLTAFCQNLVPDPSFENYESCQTNLSQFDLLVEWYNPTPGESQAGSPDYYNACSASIYWGTTNLLGNQIPRTGNGMAGLLFADLASISEFIAIELTSELVTGQAYDIGFYASHAEVAGLFAKPLGMYFSDTLILYPEPTPENGYNNGANFQFTPQFEYDEYITDEEGWEEIKSCYIAEGGEKYLIIGNFHPLIFETMTNPSGYAPFNHSYVYIDDVFVTPHVVDSSQIADLGNDTSLCRGDSLFYEFDKVFTWQDTLESNTFVIKEAGTYWASSGCDGTDTIVIEIIDEENFELIADTTLCYGQTIDLLANPSTNTSILWSDSSSANTFTISSAGIYWGKLYNHCFSKYDSVEVNYMPEVISPLGSDTTICRGDSIVLQPNLTPIIWNNNSTAPTMTVKEAGLYWIKSGRCYNDSVLINVMQRVELDLGADTTICLGETITLDVESDNINTYLWQDNYTGSVYIVSKEGEYWVVVENICDNKSDSIKVGVVPKMPDINLGNDFTYCKDTAYSLDYNFPSNMYFSYKWSDGTTSSNKSITEPGYYQLDAKSQCEQLTSNLLITQECYCDLYIPDAFSPNEDLKNDSFSIYSTCDFELYEMTIYNRWGELVFKSNNSKIHWDGTYKNQKVQKGVYTYKLKYLYELPKNHINRLAVERGKINLMK